MRRRTIVGIAAVIVLVVAIAYESNYNTPVQAVESHSTWAGYVVTAPEGSVTLVNGSWTVPTVKCGSSGSSVLVWVGIDGWGISGDNVEQVGTRTNCIDGAASYYAWYEFWNSSQANPITVRLYNITIQPGDVVLAVVSANPGSKLFSMTITDLNTGVTAHAKGKYNAAELASAEWVVEAPELPQVRYTMSDFSVVEFHSNHVSINDVSRPLNALSGQGMTSLIDASYYCSDGVQKATPSTMIRGENRFSVTWEAGGNC